MALKWIEGFEGFGTTPGVAPQPSGVLARKGYTASDESSFDIEEGWWSDSFSLEFDSSGDYLHSPTFSLTGGSASWTTVTGFAVQFSNLGAYKFFSLYSDGVEGINLKLKADGEIEVYRATTLLGTTSGAAIGVDVWFFLELKVFCHDSTGTVNVRVNESSVLSLSSIDTRVNTVYYDSWRLWSLSSGTVKFDHIHYLDGSGSKNNDLLGSKQVRTILPNAVGNDDDWTPTAGNNYECVDEDVIDDLTSYVFSGVSGQQDLYGYPDVSVVQIPDGIVGVQINNDCRRYGSIDFDLIAIAKRTSLVSAGSAIVDYDAFQTETAILESDTEGADWTLTNFNSTQFGVKIG